MSSTAAEISVDLTHTVMRILSEWKVDPADQVKLLGLPEKTKPRALKRYTESTPLPEQGDSMARITHLIAIQQYLSVMFSYNPVLGDMWVTTPSERFNNQSPLEVMIVGGIDGMERVRNHMEGVPEW
ncbi:hypothetical protein BOW53_05510 [Solemya pervernicosa gill symbiont]|uniref:Uncharacterized protein n=2 Tax=Gammaproteobacteria incertae sedis TaxID=118884 RepID=A0A1T2L7D2_9GAMM|nr:DUF2384 domain-containing protein [Candidatus Reidiella endopervernicosa]OOZ40983.1 hypothetical protein BOW53_05510 [Solemya pervernicosa gill symbiont]QKQ25035.1 DUF2384 domain-containing protein [Candidatus Reidiella endopervernicosa]